MTRHTLLPLLVLVLAGAGLAAPGDKFPPVKNSQDPKDKPPAPEESLKLITVPPGFHVTLFAGEPDVRQPIATWIDDRGRLWVAECYTYSGGSYANIWKSEYPDRLLVFEDADGDGRFDKRTVFHDKLKHLSGVATGFGGVYALCTPKLLFIPDKDGDGVPDGEPVTVLDGFALEGIGHNVVNGLAWGPDGWLYGRHGIMATSHVGAPGTPDSKRVKLNCGVWRYHPTRKTFEVVAHGTTNPWGLDWDDHGQAFFTGNVNGHLWHLIPGAHYNRMYGEGFNPRVYALLDQCADHQHWDTSKSWSDSRDAKGEHGKRGGGHSHCGGMIYLGDNWPEHYRNTVLMCNTHGRRLNNDRLMRSGSGYVGVHRDDLFFANNPWFRGTDLRYGPDGGVYVSDWCDLGECHDLDGVHRTSGRVYKITHGKPKRAAIPDFAKLSDAELVKLQLHKNDWYVRVARRHLQERAAAGMDLKAAHAALRRVVDEHPDATRKLRALWALHVSGGTEEGWLRALLAQESEHVRTWAVLLLTDSGPPSDSTLGRLVITAKGDRSSLVRLFLASALQRLPLNQRGDLALALASHAEDAADKTIPLMIWYGVEPLVGADPARAVALASAKIPLVRRHVARRLTEDVEKAPAPVGELLKATAKADARFQLDVLAGMAEALRGWRKARPPKGWDAVQARLSESGSAEVRNRVRDLAVVFGDGRALDEVRKIALDANADGDARRAALKVLIDSRPPDLLPLLQKLLPDRATVAVAMRGLAAQGAPDTPRRILSHYALLSREERVEAVGALAARPAWAAALLDAVASGKVTRAEVSAFHARQIHSLGDDKLSKRLAELWGEVRGTAEEKRKQITRYKEYLTPELLKGANLSAGRALYDRMCASCHVLYGEGKHVGPELTGSGRDNLDYVLENVVDPSAVLAAEYRLSVVAMKDGRVLSGVVGEKTTRTLMLQTQSERVAVELAEVDRVRPTTQSLMPDGLLAPLREEEVRDLIAYLMGREQVPLPKARQ